MPRKLNAIVIGYNPNGLAAKVIAAILNHQSDMTLVGVASRTQRGQMLEVARGIKVPYHQLQGYAQIPESVFTNIHVDVAVILTPSGIRTGPVESAAANGAHCLVTKPLALTGREARRLVRVCKSYEVKLGTIQPQRHVPDIWWLKQCLASGRYGTISEATVNGNLWRDQNYYNNAPWHQTFEMDNGVLGNQVQHEVDILCYLFGWATAVEGCYAEVRGHKKISVPDYAGGTVQFSNGVKAKIHGDTCTKTGFKPTEICIRGDKGLVTLRNNRVTDFSFTRGYTPVDGPIAYEVLQRQRQQGDSGHSGNAKGISFEEFIPPLAEFAGWVNDDQAPFRTAGEAGIHAVDLVEYIHLSAQNGGRLLSVNPPNTATIRPVTRKK